MSGETRVFVLGLDGATFDIIRPMVAEGRLPAFARMMREGAWGPLESVPNQRSAAAWTSLQTGTNPGKHGIFEFYDYLPETHRLKFIHASARDGRSLWRILSNQGRRVGVVNVPMTFPAEAVNGFVIAGLDCPSVNSAGFTSPPELAGDLRRAVGEYVIEPGITGALVGGRIDEAVRLIRHEFQQKMETTRFLMRSRPWDFFMVVLRSLDAAQHVFWKFGDPGHPDYDPTLAARYGSVIRDTYESIDRFLGELLDTLDERTILMVMSDHGFGRKHPATGQINPWLAGQGLLAYRPAASAGVGLLGTLYRKVVGSTSRRTKEWLWKRFPGLRDSVQSRLCFANIRWDRTRAYSDSLFANVRVNLKGREAGGIVNPGRECEELLAGLVARLKDLRDARTGEPIVAAVFRREQIYLGPYVDKAPDLLIRWREDIPIAGIRMDGAAAGRVAAAPPVPGEDPRFITGDHHLHGIFLARGAPVGAGVEVGAARIIDVAPTVLYAMGAAIPRDMDGAVLRDVFRGDFAAGRAAEYQDAAGGEAPRARGAAGYSPEEEAQIYERLKDLGYVE